MKANFILNAITLRGIGSYLYGTRLKIRPITFLCGKNGSGKSTWLKVLNFLKQNVAEKNIPFRWSIDEGNANDIKLMNSLAYCESGGYGNFPADNETADSEFGPYGTIGLEFEVVTDFSLPTEFGRPDIDPNSSLQQFLFSGLCAPGTKFTIKLSHPPDEEGLEDVAELYHLVELNVNGDFKLRFATNSRWDWKNRHGDGRYSVECSAGFLPGIAAPDDELVSIADFSAELDKVYPTGVLNDVETQYVVVCAITRIRELFFEVLSGYFYLSPIRVKHNDTSLDDPYYTKSVDSEALADLEASALTSRYVGENGELTWLLERFFAHNDMVPFSTETNQLDQNWKAPFEGFVSKWLETLFDTAIAPNPDGGGRSMSFLWRNFASGFLISERPTEFDLKYPENQLSRLVHSCFGALPQNPRQMSSGLHQILPLIVQLGLMRRYEIMAVENPEVHLHPRLQLAIAEFLLHQANAGKWLIVETHSDLIVRRVIREILEESIAIGQQKIGIYFTDIEQEEDAFRYSTLKEIETDEKTGRIKNWPVGFLDDDLKESQRLFDIMYGGPKEEDGES